MLRSECCWCSSRPRSLSRSPCLEFAHTSWSGTGVRVSGTGVTLGPPTAGLALLWEPLPPGGAVCRGAGGVQKPPVPPPRAGAVVLQDPPQLSRAAGPPTVRPLASRESRGGWVSPELPTVEEAAERGAALLSDRVVLSLGMCVLSHCPVSEPWGLCPPGSQCRLGELPP